jgi:hypothetical protein
MRNCFMDDVLRRLLPIGNSSTALLQASSGMLGKIAKPLIAVAGPKVCSRDSHLGQVLPLSLTRIFHNKQ